MRILFSSHVFHPSIGGIESVSRTLAEQFATAGHEVELITQSPGEKIADPNYGVTRRPSFWKLVELLRWCDLLFQNNISLRSLIPALLLRKRALVVHQTWTQNVRGEISWKDRIKRALLPYVTNIAISQAVADRLRTPAVVIGNPYDDNVFRLLPNIVRDKTIAFLGRLVSDKGADLLLRAVNFLADEGMAPDLTIIGSGPEEENLRQLASHLGLDRQVIFAGQKSGAPLAELLNRHRILVVPSRWPEPFGVVALEAIACGCVVVGSQEGGLPEAIGPCGVTFPNKDPRALANILLQLLRDPARCDTLRSYAGRHLAQFTRRRVANMYLEVMYRAR